MLYKGTNWSLTKKISHFYTVLFKYFVGNVGKKNDYTWVKKNDKQRDLREMTCLHTGLQGEQVNLDDPSFAAAGLGQSMAGVSMTNVDGMNM